MSGQTIRLTIWMNDDIISWFLYHMLDKLSNIIVKKYFILYLRFSLTFFAGDRARGEIRMTDSSMQKILKNFSFQDKTWRSNLNSLFYD